MKKALLAVWLSALSLSAGGAEKPSARYLDLASEFTRFADETAGMQDAARVALFHQKMGPLLPGFYEPRFGATPAQYDRDSGTLGAPHLR